MKKIKQIKQLLFIVLCDYFSLLFKSAANNHLRIQNILHNPDGTYQLIIKFDSFIELKRCQKRLRRITVSLSSVAMIIAGAMLGSYIFHPNLSNASTFSWTQSIWNGNGTGSIANASNQSGFSDYTSKKSTNVMIDVNNHVTLTVPAVSQTGDFEYSDVSSGFYLSGTTLSLKKPNGASCTQAGECSTNGVQCTNSICKGIDGTVCQNDNGCQHSWCSSATCTGSLLAGYHLNGDGVDFSGNSNGLTAIANGVTLLSDNFDTGNSVYSQPVNWQETNPSVGYTWTSQYRSANFSLYTGGSSNSNTYYRSFNVQSSGIVNWNFYGRAGNGSIVSYLDSNVGSTTCTLTGSVWIYCSGSANVSAGMHTIYFNLNTGAMLDDVIVTGPGPFTGWDSANKKFGSASVNVTSGAFLQPASNISLTNNGSANWTISVWLNFSNSFSGTYKVISQSSASTNPDQQVYIKNDNTLGTKVGAIYYQVPSYSAPTSGWHLLSAVGSGGATSFYVDGNLVGSVAAQSTQDIKYIGNSNVGSSPCGRIDDFLIFKRALPAVNIAAMASGSEYQY